MERQSIGSRRGTEESRSQANDAKRLKVAHYHEDNFPNANLEADNESNSAKYINADGDQDKNRKYSMTPEEISGSEKFSETIVKQEIFHDTFENEMQFLTPEEREIFKMLKNEPVENSEMFQQSVSGFTNNKQINQINTAESEYSLQTSEAMEESSEKSSQGSSTLAEASDIHSSGNISSPTDDDQTEFCSSTDEEPDTQGVKEKVAITNVEMFQDSVSGLTTKKKINQINTVKSDDSHQTSEAIDESSKESEQGSSEAMEGSSEESEQYSSVLAEALNIYSSDISCPTDDDQTEYSSSTDEETDTQGVNEKVETTSKVAFDMENIMLYPLQVKQLEGHADVVFCVDVDEEFLLSSSGDTTVKVWNVEEKIEISNFTGHNAAVTSVILLSSEESEALRSKLNCFQASRIAVSASYDCHIRLWSVLDGHEILSIDAFNSIICMGYLKSQNYIVVGTDGGKLVVWDLYSAEIVHFVNAHDSSVKSLKIHDCYAYSSSEDGSVKVWLFEEEELQPLYIKRGKEVVPGTSDSHPTQWQAVDVYNDLLFLGDNTPCLKVLNWRLGRLRLFLNQPDTCGVCEAVLVKDNILLTSFYDTSSDTGSINVWRLPEITYVCTLTGDLQEICSLAVVRSNEKLRIVSGGHQLVVWDFDFSKPPQKRLQDPFFVYEAEKIGSVVNEIESFSPEKTFPTAKEKNTKRNRGLCNLL